VGVKDSKQFLSYDLFLRIFFLKRCEDRNCHWKFIVIQGLFLPLAICKVEEEGRGKRQDMDSTFIYKQGSLNRGHFIIALKFTGARKPTCHPTGWPWLGSSWVCKVVGGGRIITY
jgi:hypothetical protein